MKVTELRARLTRKDNDIKHGMGRLELKEGELHSDIVRDAVRALLVRRGLIQTEDDLGCFDRRVDE